MAADRESDRRGSPADDPANLADLLQARARDHAERIAYRFLSDGEEETDSVTYAGLDRRAREIASVLRTQLDVGDRALLVYPAGIDFISAFFGCAYAGVVPVPVCPPERARHMPRLNRVIEDARAGVAMTTSAVRAEIMERTHGGTETLASWLETDAGKLEIATASPPHEAGLGDLACLQYTSGSTTDPRGVMVTHGNFIANLTLARWRLRCSPDTVAVAWAPNFHDLGLVLGLLTPLFAAGSCVILPPLAVAKRPLQWLRAMSRYRANLSGGPNFIFDLCVRKISREQRAELDLSHWEAAYIGAEPVRFQTMERFTREFEECGFRSSTFRPGYGLAEATLMVSIRGPEPPRPAVLWADREALREHRVVETANPAKAQPVVGCGPIESISALIVEPEEKTPCAAGSVGEVWLAGPSVTAGYWNRPEQTEAVFGAQLRSGDGRRFLRTGDLGFLRNGEIYLTGRRKELIIINGRCHYPQDIEATVAISHPSLRPGCGAAFAVSSDAGDRLVVVYEVRNDPLDAAQAADITGAIRRAVAAEHGVRVADVALLQQGGTFKTTSGKIQRNACREAYLERRLPNATEESGDAQ